MPAPANKTRIPLGKDAKAYINKGTTESPTWIEVSIIKDATLEISKSDTDVTTRGAGGWKEVMATLKEASVDFGAVWDKEDECYTILLRSMLFDDVIEMLFLDGDKEVEGSQGLHAMMQVFSFKRDEKLTDALAMDVNVKPCYGAIKPKWVTVDAEGLIKEVTAQAA